MRDRAAMADPHDDRLDRRRFGVAGLQTLLAWGA